MTKNIVPAPELQNKNLSKKYRIMPVKKEVVTF